MDQSNNIPPKYRPDVETLAEMFSISHEAAFSCLKIAQYNKERAIQNFINPQFVQANFYSQVPRVGALGSEINHSIDVEQGLEVEQFVPNRYGRRAQFNSGGHNLNKLQEFKKTYMIKKKEKPKKIKNRRRPKGKNTPESGESKDKIVEQFVFVEELEKMLQNQVGIAFQSDLYEVFNKMHQQKKLVALHSLKLAEEKDKITQQLSLLHEYIKNLYKIPEFVLAFNKTFINFGLDASKFDFQHYSFMKDFIKPQTDDFTIVVLRYNHHANNVELFRTLRINNIFKLAEKDKFASVVNQILSQSNRVAYNASVGIKPMSEYQKRKLEEDRRIRQLQQKQYLQSVRTKKQQQMQQEMQLKQEAEIKETIEQKKGKIRQSLVKYDPQTIDSPITFKIRFPSGVTVSLVLPKEEKIEYLFNYVFLHEKQEIGFQNAKEFSFDILQPFEKLFLSARKQEQISAVFEGSDMQTLVVKQT